MKHGNKKNGFLFILCMLLSTLTFAQQRELTGTVKDNKGEPLPGVSILIKATVPVRLPTWTVNTP